MCGSLVVALLLLLCSGSEGLGIGRVGHGRTRTVRMSAADAEALASAVQACMAIKASEIKAELDLRKIPHDDLFEKAELASRLARARIAGAVHFDTPVTLLLFTRFIPRASRTASVPSTQH